MIICPWKDIKKYASLLPGIEEAFDAVNALTEYENKKSYPLSDGNRINVAVQATNPVALAEAHREFIDVQYIIKGSEYMGWADLADCKLEGDFNETKDVGFYSGDYTFHKINAGTCYVAFPEDVHMPARHLDEPTDVVKVIVKLKVK